MENKLMLMPSPPGAFVMERRPEMDAPRAVPALPAPVSAALALGLALALGAGETAAQGVCMGEVVTGRTSRVLCDRGPGDMRDIHIDLRDPAIVATGYNEFAIVSDARGVGDVTIEVTGGSLTSSGDWGKGIRFWSNYRDAVGDLVIRLKDVDMTITGLNNNAIFARRLAGTGDVEIDVSGGSITATTTKSAIGSGIFGHHQALNRAGNVAIAFRGGSLLVNGLYGDGVHGQRDDGVRGEVDLTVADASIETRGLFTRAISGISASRQGDVTIDVSGNSVITAEGESGVGVYAAHTGNGSVHATIGAETRITAPFSDGVHGRLTSAADAAGRVVIASGAMIEARDAGILAFTEPRSGSTFGDGNEAADETARTAPMIHVTSSGDITVGGNVMDAYIRSVVAGEDETLQAGERAVLDAIAGGDSDALTTALGALPDDYDDAWKARMRAFQTARGAKLTNLHRLRRSLPGTNAKLAEQATIEILDIPRAGIRAMALSPTEIADYIRRGGLGGSLSDDERTVLEAVLTGGDVEAALAALPADYTDNWKDGVRLRAMSYNAGDIQVDVTSGTITSEGDGVHARYVVPHDRNGAIAVTVAAGAEITGGRHGIFVGGAGLAAGGGLRDQTVTVNGAVMGGTGAGVHLAGGGTVTVGETGRVRATSGMAVLSDGPGDLTLEVLAGGVVTGAIGNEAGDLSVTVAGRVESDDLRAPTGGELTLDVQEGGVVTGTVHDPAGPLTVRGSIGRLLYTNGGTVTVAATGELTGVKVEDGTEALRSEAGDLDVTVAGTVAGDLRAPTGGALTLDVQEGGEVTGTVHDPAGPLTVAGSIGRLLYTNGGTVTVAATGELTGVEVEGGIEALRSEAGDLDVTVAGTVTGDLRAPTGGALAVDVQEGGEVTGTVHDPAGPLTIHGSIGRLLYTNGGAVTVAATGELTGVEVEGGTEAVRNEAGDLDVTVAEMGTVTGNIRGLGAGGLSAMVAGTITGDVIEEGAGDLDATISGTVEGNVFGRGTGEHTVTVSNGGTVRGTIHLAASTVTVDGTAGRVQFDNGGMVTVGGTGELTGVEVEGRREAVRSKAGDLAVTVAGTVTGDIIEEGAGDLDATISGTVEGNVFGRGTGEHTVTVSNGGTVRGTIHLAASTVTVDGTAGRVQFDNGGMVTVGRNGQVTGIGGVAVGNAQGELVVLVQQRPGETPFTALSRGVQGAIDVPEEDTLVLLTQREGEAPRRVGEAGTASSAPDGAEDVGVERTRTGGVQVVRKLAPRSRLYEALPSVLLGLNAPVRYEERMAAARAEQGGWARVETVHGKWKADASTSQKEEPGVELEYDHRRHGLQAGVDVAAGEDGLFGVSLHHRRGSADVSKGGKVELSGHGVGVSGAWVRDGVYVDVQAEATWYEADFTSSLRGALKQDVSGHGYALGVEAGRRIASGWAGIVLTPRAGLVHSRVFVGGFTDAVGTRVSVEDGRSLKGRAGMVVEVKPQWWARGSRMFGSVDVEREFSKDRKVRVSGTELRSEADATWLRFGLNGSHVLDGGRWTVAGRVGYATSGGSHELGGGLHLKMRF